MKTYVIRWHGDPVILKVVRPDFSLSFSDMKKDAKVLNEFLYRHVPCGTLDALSALRAKKIEPVGPKTTSAQKAPDREEP